MEYEFTFKTEEEKEQLIKDNSNLTLIKIAYHLGEKYLIFTDEKIEYELTENEILANKISILEAENKELKSITKDQDQLLIDNAYKITMLEMTLGGI